MARKKQVSTFRLHLWASCWLLCQYLRIWMLHCCFDSLLHLYFTCCLANIPSDTYSLLFRNLLHCTVSQSYSMHRSRHSASKTLFIATFIIIQKIFGRKYIKLSHRSWKKEKILWDLHDISSPENESLFYLSKLCVSIWSPLPIR